MRKAIGIVLGLVLLSAAVMGGRVRAESTVTWDEVIAWARADAQIAGVNAAWVERVLWCEGAGNPYASGARGEVGPAQFLPRGGLWWDLPESRIVPLDYSRTSLRYQVQAMVGAFARGLSSHWSCK